MMLVQGIKNATQWFTNPRVLTREKDFSTIGFLLFAAAATTTTSVAFVLSPPEDRPNNFFHNQKKLEFCTPSKFFPVLSFNAISLMKPTIVQCSNSFDETSILKKNSSDASCCKTGCEQDPSTYVYEKLKLPSRSEAQSHAIFGPLFGSDLIERYNLYRRVDIAPKISSSANVTSGPKEVAVATVRIGKHLNGHTGIVHGGIISLLFDEAMGWGYYVLVKPTSENFKETENKKPKFTKGVTANLNIDFRSPLKEDSSVVIRVYHVRTERRKVFFNARMESNDGKILYSEAKALFIMLKE